VINQISVPVEEARLAKRALDNMLAGELMQNKDKLAPSTA